MQLVGIQIYKFSWVYCLLCIEKINRHDFQVKGNHYDPRENSNTKDKDEAPKSLRIG